MGFTIRVACDVGSGRLNIGIDFGERPQALRDVVQTIEAIFSTELRLHKNDANAHFRCVSIMLATAAGVWEEVIAADQIHEGAQLFAFDWSSPPPSSEPLPPAEFVVAARDVTTGNTAVHQPLNDSKRVKYPQSSALPPGLPVASQSGVQSSQLPADARSYLFAELCRASGSTNSISARTLRRICDDYGLEFSSEEFCDVVDRKPQLDRNCWERLEVEYGPFVDLLYERISAASSDAPAEGSRSVANIREKLAAVEREEAELLAKQAALRQQAAALQRELREAEQRAARNRPSQDRQWASVKRFVALRHRQKYLMEEGERVRRELDLL